MRTRCARFANKTGHASRDDDDFLCAAFWSVCVCARRRNELMKTSLFHSVERHARPRLPRELRSDEAQRRCQFMPIVPLESHMAVMVVVPGLWARRLAHAPNSIRWEIKFAFAIRCD